MIEYYQFYYAKNQFTNLKWPYPATLKETFIV